MTCVATYWVCNMFVFVSWNWMFLLLLLLLKLTFLISALPAATDLLQASKSLNCSLRKLATLI